jgi:hypothetical protein
MYVYVRMSAGKSARAPTTTNSDATAKWHSEPDVTGSILILHRAADSSRHLLEHLRRNGRRLHRLGTDVCCCLSNHPFTVSSPSTYPTDEVTTEAMWWILLLPEFRLQQLHANTTLRCYCANCTARSVQLVDASSSHAPCCITLRGHRKVHQRSNTLRSSARWTGMDIFRYIFILYEYTLCNEQ